jgi:apolipoprotein N-acyltransferase
MGAATHEVGTNLVQNSALLIRRDGTIAGRYDKRALVPFSEFVPFSDRFPEWAERVRTKLPGEPRFSPGDRAVVLREGDLRIGALVCSEDLGPEFAAELAAAGANLLVVIGSDAWLGDGPGARQHLALASIRAVETRRQVVRTMNTGVSAHIDARGRVLASGPLVDPPRGQIGEPALMVIEPALVDRATLGPIVIGWFSYGCAGVLALLAIYESVKRERRKKRTREKRAQR